MSKKFIFIALLTLLALLSVCIGIKDADASAAQMELGSDIVLLGDSITEGINWTDENIINKGIGGDNTQMILDRLDEIVEINPKQVFLMIGINDIGMDSTTPESFLENYEEIILTFKKQLPHTVLCIESILPCNTSLMDKNTSNSRRNPENIQSYNKTIKSLCERHGIIYIDLYSCFADKAGEMKLEYTKDGVHLSLEGYRLMTDKLNQYLA